MLENCGTIMVVDDDPHINDVISFALSSAGYKVCTTNDGLAALELFSKASPKPELIVLDINLPGRDGLWVCQKIREFSQVPILFLSARDEEVDRVMGLTIGGDDYVTKPFSPRELVARVKAILRRHQGTLKTKDFLLEAGSLKLNLESFVAYWQDEAVELTATEFNLLKTFATRPQKAYSRDELLDLVYQDTIVSDRTIDSHILHIRKKFSALGANDIIATQHGIGYKLGSCRLL